MLKRCQFCGAEFDGSPQARFCSDAHRKAASRKSDNSDREVGQSGPLPEKSDKPVETEIVTARPSTLRGLILAARAGEISLSEREEQAIRDYYGYSSSEKRTLLQRDQVAERITASLGPASLSLKAFPNQTGGDLTPTPAQLAKLGETVGQR